MEYTYNIYDDIYSLMLSGKKNVEVRLLNEKSEKILVGDFITFNNLSCEGRYIKVKVTSKNIYNDVDEMLLDNDIEKIFPGSSKEELTKLLVQIFGEAAKKSKIVTFSFVVVDTDLDIEVDRAKDIYEKVLTNDKVINITGSSGSGKSTYVSKYFNGDEYIVVDTDEIFVEHRFLESTGINKMLGEYFRGKYSTMPTLETDFDLIYKEILEYFKDSSKTIVIDCEQFKYCQDFSILKGNVIVIRTGVDTCYERCLLRYKKTHDEKSVSYTKEEFDAYAEKKKRIYLWRNGLNIFIRKIDCL